ncbi:hypothetical protein HA402_001391 [Bradysia odoriphaga]|nr:hypothetical protein HA402_001391 [Bradysia odoriphaga]
MKFRAAAFIIGLCCIVSFADADTTEDTCVIPQCFNCTQCEVDCNTLDEACDTECVGKARKFVCELEKDHCRQMGGCNTPPTSIQIYPSAYYYTWRREWAPKTIEMRSNCCYNLNNPAWQPWYDNTLSALKKPRNACVILYDGLDCSGASVKVDSTWTTLQLQWIDHASRTSPPVNGIKFNDKTSSMSLC